MQKDKDLSFDAFRGVAIIAVIAIHASATGFSWRYSTTGQWNFYFLLAYVQPLLFAVPALFFMSGYWSSKKPIESLHDYGTFLKRKLLRVLIPYLFWSFILLGYAAVKTQKISVYKITLAIFTGGACYPYYFIIVIIQLYLMTPLLDYINRRRFGLILVLVLTAVSFSAVYLSRVCGVIFRLPIYLPFYSWLIYYEIGLLIGASRNKAIPFGNLCLFILPVALVSLLMSEIEAATLVSKGNNLLFAISPVKYSTLSYSVCVIVAFLLARERIRHWPKFLATCGGYSFGIYLIHLPVLNQVAEFVRQYERVYLFQPLYQLVVILITISICFVLIGITRKLLPESFCRRVLGF